MYKVLIVDDERWVVIDILYSFPWEKFGFKVAAYTTDPVQAIDLTKNIKPDVVFLDIRMPAISGLDLIPILKKDNPNMLFVLITGYSDFEYAVSAIKLQVFDYILKPVNEKESTYLLERLKNHLIERDKKMSVIPDKISVEDDQFSKILQYLNDHIYDNITLKELSEKFYMNPNYCGYLFKVHTGKSFSQYVLDVRMNTASYLLKHSKLRINEVAQRVGYDNPHYFSRLFTKYFKVNPRDYRRQNYIV